MKKIILGVAVLAAFSLASCKKANRVCECTHTDGKPSSQYTIEDKTTKKNAKYYCETQHGQSLNIVVTSPDGITYTETPNTTTSCKLK